MTSLRTAIACAGFADKNVAVCGELFGFKRGQVPPDPTGVKAKVSIRQQIQSLRNLQFHLNVIAVGSDLFSDSDYIEIDYSIYRIRYIYAQVGIAVGRVQHYTVTTAEALGHENPTNDEALKALTHMWRVPNDGIHVFVPFLMNVPLDKEVAAGKSIQVGPCEGETRDNNKMNASVVGLFGSEETATTFAHEVGHYLGLEHKDTANNLMLSSGTVNDPRQEVLLDEVQGEIIRAHCLVKPGCFFLFQR